MPFTGETKHGYTDGEHFANHGVLYPIFARVVNGELYAVGREDNPAWQGTRFGKCYRISREWMRVAFFANTPSDADYFVDGPHAVEDDSVPGSQYIKSNDSTQILKRPNGTAPATTPTPVPTPEKVVPKVEEKKVETPLQTTVIVPTSTTTTTPTVVETKKKLPTWAVIAICLGAVAAIGGLFCICVSKNKMAKVIELTRGDPFTHLFFCEGCGCGHGFNVSHLGVPIWTYNNDPDKPTIQPSLLVQTPLKSGMRVCHSFVTDGRIQYLADSTHRLAGQTVDLIDVDDYL